MNMKMLPLKRIYLVTECFDGAAPHTRAFSTWNVATGFFLKLVAEWEEQGVDFPITDYSGDDYWQAWADDRNWITCEAKVIEREF